MSKKLLVSMAVCGICLAAFPVLAQPTHSPNIDQQEFRQQQRIDQGVHSGQLTPREANRVNNELQRTERLEDKFKADGRLSRNERNVLNNRLHQSSQDISRLRHNDRQRPGACSNDNRHNQQGYRHSSNNRFNQQGYRQGQHRGWERAYGQNRHQQNGWNNNRQRPQNSWNNNRQHHNRSYAYGR